nr:zinc finger protein 800b [Misgurnus anguillicaudatus]XP_055047113.1 zinc finger protein 800b [Misgurnus anguillicaudatus]XP_055047114.1 zinc finger protein 800b [Misgurnus anguillicaudatus]
MEEPISEACTMPANEKSCQTDDLTDEAVVPGPDHASKTLVNSTEVGDPPLLQRPLETSKSGIQQIIECFRTGTAQLKHILLKEVDTIFECKLCRSLFRGLPNLIKHKEVYCLPRHPESEDSFAEGKNIKELLEAIYPRSDRQEYFLRLEPIDGNQNAVFQYLSTEKDLPPSSQSPNHTSTDGWSHHQPNTDDISMNEEEDHRIEEEGKLSLNAEDAVISEQQHQDNQLSSEERSEEDSSPCRCLLCNRTYKVRGHLQRHLRAVHKIITSDCAEPTKITNGKPPESPGANSSSSSESQKSPREENKIPWKPIYSMGFDLKTRFCKLCRRTFSSEQNLAKHIELHTDNGTDFFVKFYCCPLCRYKTRRKRDVVRHLSEFHKKKSAYLSRISQSLDNSTIKTPAEAVLNKAETKDQGRHETKVHPSHSSPYLTRRNLLPNARRATAEGKKTVSSKTQVKHDDTRGKAMQSMLVCSVCGKGFRKQRHLGLHMRNHQKMARGGAAGIRTRSKVVF